MSRTRLLSLSDVPVLAELLLANREFLAPWEPVRADAWFTEQAQAEIAERVLAQQAEGRALPLVILDDDGALAGRLNINGVVRGALQSAALGYWVDAARCGRGLATSAVREAVALAFGELGLHRLQAEILPVNTPSRRVLQHVGFQQYGTAPDYLHIAGSWQTCEMFQLLAPDPR